MPQLRPPRNKKRSRPAQMVPSVEPRRARRVGGATGCTHATMCAPKPVPAPELEDRSSIRDGAGVEKARRRGDGVRVGLQAIRSPSTRRVVARALTAERPSKRPVLIQSAVRIRSAMPKGVASPKRAPRAVDCQLCWQRLGSRRAFGLVASHRSETSSTGARDRRTSVSLLADNHTSSRAAPPHRS